MVQAVHTQNVPVTGCRIGWGLVPRFKQRLMIICGLLAAELAEDWFQAVRACMLICFWVKLGIIIIVFHWQLMGHFLTVVCQIVSLSGTLWGYWNLIWFEVPRDICHRCPCIIRLCSSLPFGMCVVGWGGGGQVCVCVCACVCVYTVKTGRTIIQSKKRGSFVQDV